MSDRWAVAARDLVGDEGRAAFASDGFLVLPGFYDVEAEIDPIRRGIHRIVALVAEEHGVDLGAHEYDPTHFDDGYLALKAVDRRHAGVVYDAVKQLSSFVRLVASPLVEAVYRHLRGADTVGIAGGGSGIRIDNPDEPQYRAWWHQEYPAQLRSVDGLVVWSPLREVTAELGPVEILRGSHREGLLAVVHEDRPDRRDPYAVRLHREVEVVERYEAVAPLAAPGDAVLIDFLTVHRSGANTSSVPRWTMQSRWFDFSDPTGRSHGWSGSFAAGTALADVHPELEVRS